LFVLVLSGALDDEDEDDEKKSSRLDKKSTVSAAEWCGREIAPQHSLLPAAQGTAWPAGEHVRQLRM
jgi:hypothetical protein